MSVWQWFTDPANWTGPNGIPTRTLQHIWISFAAMAIAVAVALPLGLLLGHKRKGTVLASNVGNVGRAVPTLGVLIILASIAAPALVKLGVPLLATHFFVFYYGVLADITPPVALAAYAAAGMAGEDEVARGALQELRRVQPNVSLDWIRSQMPIHQEADLAHYVEGFRRAGLT